MPSPGVSTRCSIARWDADALRDVEHEYEFEALADPDVVLILDETRYLMQGKASGWVHRQYTGSPGNILNCLLGVKAAYASRHGHAFSDRALYLPKIWISDPARLAAAYVSEWTSFATKPGLALAAIEQAMTDGVPFSWIAADTAYGVCCIERALRRAGKVYVFGVKTDHASNPWVRKLATARTAGTIANSVAPSA